MGTGEKLNIFFKFSPLGDAVRAIEESNKIITGESESYDASQKNTVKSIWKGLSNIPENMQAFYSKSMVDILMAFGLDAESTESIVGGFIKGKPDVPIIGGLWMFIANLLIMGKVATTGLQSAGEQIDKKYRSIIKPGVGSLNDWIAAYRRANEPEEMLPIRDETGMPDDWHKIIELATQWWPGVGDLQKIFRRGNITEEQFLEALKSLGVKSPAWEDMLKATTFDVPGPADVMEMFRRKGLDWNGVDDWLKIAGFDAKPAELLKATASRLVELPNLFAMRQRGLIDDRKLVEKINMFGYETGAVDELSKLWRNLPDGFQLTQGYFRGVIGQRQYLEGLGNLGYDEPTAKLLESIAWQLPGPADLMRFGVREVFTPAIAARFGQYQQYPTAMTPWAKKIGMSEEIAKMYWAAHWDLPAVGQMFDMFHRGIISRADLQMGVRARDVMPFWQNKVIDLSYRLIPRRTLPRFIRQELITFDDAVRRFRKLGFQADDAGIMAESAVLDITEEERGLTRADIINALKYGWYDEEQARTALTSLRYGSTAVNWYIADGLRRRGLEEARTASENDIDDATVALDLTKAEIVRGYSGGMIDREAARSTLQAVGLSDEAIEYKLDYTDLVKARQDKDFAARQYKRLFDAHLADGTTIENNLLNAGYTVVEARRLVEAWTLERSVKDRLEAVRDRLPTVGDLAGWLKQGIITMEGWLDYMGRHGYPDEVMSMQLQEILIKTGE